MTTPRMTPMMINEARDPILRLLARLPPATPSAAFDQRARARCHLALAKRQRLPAHRNQLTVTQRGVVNATLAMTAALYAAAAALEALRLAGLL